MTLHHSFTDSLLHKHGHSVELLILYNTSYFRSRLLSHCLSFCQGFLHLLFIISLCQGSSTNSRLPCFTSNPEVEPSTFDAERGGCFIFLRFTCESNRREERTAFLFVFHPQHPNEELEHKKSTRDSTCSRE